MEYQSAEIEAREILDNFAVLHLEPGDTLVLMTDNLLSAQARQRIESCLREIVGDSRKILLLEGGIKLGILRGSEGGA